ncbi:cell cycle protein kinase-like protein [Dothidotthia symphoricarpi CBS 119687]|uniref:non-specific serine/threonine protein kinase n=1 Tax=Dothidotthia symphoricarpi CBS 119687 TaxID=1392245 RepID=A0A6A6ARE2_9PLEO|nr:cell cycle protein kinase-like protein [Dothidotthia symphoricarpi CBS 119687]KAF2134380.1 cell cycle protein kinase-like protein [Dothidotthia symphoricarpi CBS 119687]
MARPRVSLQRHVEDFEVHEDAKEEDAEETLDESMDPLEESGPIMDDSDEDVEESVADDMARFEETFVGINKRFRLINRIGEGTFSTVYKAEDLEYDKYGNTWDMDEHDDPKWATKRPARRPHYVAIKKIYVTSSPIRIFNELELLHDLRDSDSVCPLITAFRHLDQVVAVLPYFQHHDFRDYYRDMKIPEMRLYFRSLFTALRSVHAKKIIHRDVKPTNFLYNPSQLRGVLVDFGLAEREGTDWHQCACHLPEEDRRYKLAHSVYAQTQSAGHNASSYPKNDTRNSRRANRAGTRGFRAPEVLLKCTQQTCSLDMWSVGVILLTMLSHRFPFFHSADDVDALLEITTIFGRKKMRETSLLHGQVFETNIPSYSEGGHTLEKIILWCTGRTGDKTQPKKELEDEEKEAVQFLHRLLECNPAKRITADEALRHPFIAKACMEGEEVEDMNGLVEA